MDHNRAIKQLMFALEKHLLILMDNMLMHTVRVLSEANTNMNNILHIQYLLVPKVTWFM
jgi:hypothetical protein